jgi:tetratricopeptide (TPR) repeat protein
MAENKRNPFLILELDPHTCDLASLKAELQRRLNARDNNQDSFEKVILRELVVQIRDSKWLSKKREEAITRLDRRLQLLAKDIRKSCDSSGQLPLEKRARLKEMRYDGKRFTDDEIDTALSLVRSESQAATIGAGTRESLPEREFELVCGACREAGIVSLFQHVKCQPGSSTIDIEGALKNARKESRERADKSSAEARLSQKLLELAGQYLTNEGRRSAYLASLRLGAEAIIWSELSCADVESGLVERVAALSVACQWLPVSAAETIGVISDFAEWAGWPDDVITAVIDQSSLYCPDCQKMTPGEVACRICHWPREIVCPQCAKKSSTSQMICVNCDFSLGLMPGAVNRAVRARGVRDSDPREALRLVQEALPHLPRSSEYQALDHELQQLVKALGIAEAAERNRDTDPGAGLRSVQGLDPHLRAHSLIAAIERQLQAAVVAAEERERTDWSQRFSAQLTRGAEVARAVLAEGQQRWPGAPFILEAARALDQRIAEESSRQFAAGVQQCQQAIAAGLLQQAAHSLDSLETLGELSGEQKLRIGQLWVEYHAQYSRHALVELIPQGRVLEVQREIARTRGGLSADVRSQIQKRLSLAEQWSSRGLRAEADGDFKEAIRCLALALEQVGDDPKTLQARSRCIAKGAQQREIVSADGSLTRSTHAQMNSRATWWTLAIAISLMTGGLLFYVAPNWRRERELDTLTERIASGASQGLSDSTADIAGLDQRNLRARLIQRAESQYRRGLALSRTDDVKANQAAYESFRSAARCHAWLAEEPDPVQRKLQGECLWYAARSALAAHQPESATRTVEEAVAAVTAAVAQFRVARRNRDAEVCEVIANNIREWLKNELNAEGEGPTQSRGF